MDGENSLEKNQGRLDDPNTTEGWENADAKKQLKAAEAELAELDRKASVGDLDDFEKSRRHFLPGLIYNLRGTLGIKN